MKTIVISGSIKKAGKGIEQFANKLEKLGVKVIYPNFNLEKDLNNLSEHGARKLFTGLTIEYFNYIERADLVFVYNKDGYSGNSVTLEIGYAYAMKKPIYALTQDLEICRDVLFDGYAKTPKELIQKL